MSGRGKACGLCGPGASSYRVVPPPAVALRAGDRTANRRQPRFPDGGQPRERVLERFPGRLERIPRVRRQRVVPLHACRQSADRRQPGPVWREGELGPERGIHRYRYRPGARFQTTPNAPGRRNGPRHHGPSLREPEAAPDLAAPGVMPWRPRVLAPGGGVDWPATSSKTIQALFTAAVLLPAAGPPASTAPPRRDRARSRAGPAAARTSRAAASIGTGAARTDIRTANGVICRAFLSALGSGVTFAFPELFRRGIFPASPPRSRALPWDFDLRPTVVRLPWVGWPGWGVGHVGRSGVVGLL